MGLPPEAENRLDADVDRDEVEYDDDDDRSVGKNALPLSSDSAECAPKRECDGECKCEWS